MKGLHIPILLWIAFISGLASKSVLSAEVGATKIVLIGGPKSHGLGEHDFHHGVEALKRMLESADGPAGEQPINVVAAPHDWPSAQTLSDAATLVLYFDGNRRHPLLDPQRRADFQALMSKGVGVVALHQAFTVRAEDEIMDFKEWLGGVRRGLRDRTWETVRLLPTAGHPVTRGVGEMILYDEYYPTIEFATGANRPTAVLTGVMRAQFELGVPVHRESRISTAAWAFERAGGGRSFAFSGAHFVRVLDEPELRKLLLNAIFWTARLQVPSEGVTTRAPAALARALSDPGHGRAPLPAAVVTRRAQQETVAMPWGHLEWHVSGKLGNSDSMTTGIARIAPGQNNPRHFHPNCDEVLHVLQGRIRHTMDDRSVEMSAGDTVTIPRGVKHNATNIGDEEAVLAISFSSAWREVVGE